MTARIKLGLVRFCNTLIGVTLLLASDVALEQVQIREQDTPTLGILLSGSSGRNFILNTDDTVSGADAADYVTGANSGRLRIRHVGGPVDANILAENISSIGGISVNGVPCRWRNQTPTTCDGSGIDVRLNNRRRSLWLGVNIDTTQSHSGGDTASVNYDITVTLI